MAAAAIAAGNSTGACADVVGGLVETWVPANHKRGGRAERGQGREQAKWVKVVVMFVSANK
jgi:hypothetical protein